MTERLIPETDLLLPPGYVHLQTGGVGTMPRAVFEAFTAAAAKVENDPVGETYGPGIGRIDRVREKAANLLGCRDEDIVITSSTTSGMFLLAQGLDLGPGDRIIITDHEHPGGQLGWEWAARRFGAIIDVVSIPPSASDLDEIVAAFEDAIRPETRVISFSHILFTTGVRLPAEQICALARKHGCLAIVDGAQSAGAMPVDVVSMGCHAFSASGHKWLMGPKGTGLLYLHPELSGRLDALPLMAGRRFNSDSTGIGNIAGAHGLGAAIDYAMALTPEKIEDHNLALRSELFDALGSLAGIEIPSPREGPTVSANLAFTLPRGTDHNLVRRNLLLRHKTRLRVVERSGFIALRASLHCHNRSEDVALLIDALGKELS